MITIFKNIRETKTPHYVNLDTIVKRIKTGHNKELVSKIRPIKEKKERDKLKMELPSICFSGEFSHRANDGIKTHSGYVCLDFDHLPVLMESKAKFMIDKYVCCVFISPSGDGLKVVIKIPANIETHKSSCRALKEYFKDELLDEFEDIARVCYESWDEEIYYNPNSEIFTELIIEEIKEKKITIRDNNSNNIFNKLKTWIEKTECYSDGSKHKFLVKLAGALNKFGVNKYEAANLLISHYQHSASYVKEKDFEDIVNRVYNTYANQFNTDYFDTQGVALERTTRKETAKDFYNEYKIEDKSLLLRDKLVKHLINFEDKIQKPPTILAIRNEYDFREISIFTLGNISVIKGPAKSKKTYLASIFASSLVKNYETFRNIVPSLPEDKRNTIYIDTEQSRYDSQRLAHRIKKMSNCDAHFLIPVNFRGLSANELIEMIVYIVENFTNIGVIFMDQVADMVKSLNSEEEAVNIVKLLEKISAEKNIHICCIVHINKADNFAQGWLGTQLMKKAETIINISKNKMVKAMGEVEPDLTRGEDFEPFAFFINKEGLPEMADREVLKNIKKEQLI